MNKLLKEGAEFVERFKGQLHEIPGSVGTEYEVVIAPSATHLSSLAPALKGTNLRLAGQNCGTASFGAFTGETSPTVLKEIGADWVILGHSERRHVYGETDRLILSRVKAAMEEGLNVILCVGETQAERKGGQTFKVIETQLSILGENQLPPNFWNKLVVAYEPVWAIGTGDNASPEQAQEAHAFIRSWVLEKGSAENAPKLRILYGGSVKADNAAAIMAQKDVDGLLVGGASLDPVGFAGIIRNGLKSRT